MNDLTAHLADLRTEAPDGLEDRVLAATGHADRYVTRPSPLGTLFVSFNHRGVNAVDLADDSDSFERIHRERTGRAAVPADIEPPFLARRLDAAIAEGRPGSLPLDLSDLTEFQRSVLLKAAEIPSGEVRPYGWIAKEIGKPGAVRAVGSALARNPVPVIIPCHRVVRSDGSLGRYSLGEDANKEVLLEAEGLPLEEFLDLARHGVRFVGTTSTGIFCHPTCGHSLRARAENRVDFTSEQDALQAGYRPCKVCRPVAA
jgi:methylated-DNA-[protein]-cysteine S-methyltransferase